jgi:uncharacterized membrane protein
MRFGVVLFVAGIIALCCSMESSTAGMTSLDEPKKTEEKKDEKKDDKKDEKAPSFKNDVMPILTNSCGNCHAGKKKRGGVDLSTYETVMKSVKASEPDKSRLIKSVIGQGAKLMPPKTGLGEDDVKVLKAWIMAGAKND